ncbi:MAG: 3-keto-5-aminohexanoate cleavage protein [Deltaproteobacteria bacterium]|nr:3-keto-5-aminohexanoate cleavage protein [Deltaproteobacteria bacterium]
MNRDPLIITVAAVGAETTREQTPYLPITAEEIGEEAKRVREAGACMIHLHVRKDDGTPTQDKEFFRRAIEEIRKRTDIIIQVSTGGAVWMTAEERAQPLELNPQMASLTVGTCNFGDEVFSNPFPLIRRLAQTMRERDIVPEIEIFDVGFIDNAKLLIKQGVLMPPLHFDFVMGVPGAMGADESLLDFLISRLPEDSTWSVAGIGRHEFSMAELAIKKGGHVRVGLEDNIYIEKGVLAKGNVELVEKVVEMAKKIGRPLATIEEAKKILRLKR